jgi:phosphoglycolate phosphatase-like HAD superfamily hydrolase
MENIIVDLDGTIADISHRLHYIQDEVKQWDAFFKACTQDTPRENVVELLRILQEAYSGWPLDITVHIWTGRSDAVLKETVQWLKNHNIPYDWIKMRSDGDYRPDHELKQDWLDSAPFTPDLVLEDRTRVVDMWRSNGIECWQVNSGDF